jgi:hypothetical protein
MVDINQLTLLPKTIKQVRNDHQGLSGRDIKLILKLAAMVSRRTGRAIDSELIGEIKHFKPTAGEMG